MISYKYTIHTSNQILYNLSASLIRLFSCASCIWKSINTERCNSAIIQIDLDFAPEKNVSNSFKINWKIVNKFFEQREIALNLENWNVSVFGFYYVGTYDPFNLIKRKIHHFIFLFDKYWLSFLFWLLIYKFPTIITKLYAHFHSNWLASNPFTHISSMQSAQERNDAKMLIQENVDEKKLCRTPSINMFNLLHQHSMFIKKWTIYRTWKHKSLIILRNVCPRFHIKYYEIYQTRSKKNPLMQKKVI